MLASTIPQVNGLPKGDGERGDGERSRIIRAGDASSKPGVKSRHGRPFRHIVAPRAVRGALSRAGEANLSGGVSRLTNELLESDVPWRCQVVDFALVTDEKFRRHAYEGREIWRAAN
jgi:hypothetical protein